ncbi:MAG: hypothetical protein K2P12_04765, partial [Clostridia bacterium]|nr:hypothetical protein [Clostridia bacterium]
EYESDFLYTKLNQLAINYVKINPTNLRQIEEKFACTEFKIKNSESFRNLQDNQTNHLQLNTITNQTSDSVNHEEIDNEITNTFKVVKTSNHSYDSDLICKKEEFSKPATKLTPEQIKKIYTYIKLKQLKQALNKAE